MSLLGILFGVVIYMLVGMVWYSRLLFRETFLKLAKIQAEKPTGKIWAGALLNAFLISVGLSYAFGAVQSGGFFTGVSVAITLGIFFVIPPIFSQVLWAKMPFKLFCIHAGSLLVAMALIGGVLKLI